MSVARLPLCDLLAALSLAYGWTPKELLDLTLPQLEYYLDERKTNDTATFNNRYEAERFSKTLRQRRRQWVCRQMHARRFP